MSSGLPPEKRETVPLNLAAAAANSMIPEGESPTESSSSRLLLDAVLELPALFTPANSGLDIFPFRDTVPGLENPGKQQSAR